MNVRINLASIKDREFVAQMAGRVEELETRVKKIEEDILSGLKLET
jgi:formiminotetrahydrofolate cyclodeaminase